MGELLHSFDSYLPLFLLFIDIISPMQAGGALTSVEPPPIDAVEPAASPFGDILAEEVRARDTEVYPLFPCIKYMSCQLTCLFAT